MIKKISFVTLIISLACSMLYAKPDPDKFFYDKGFSDGKKEGLRLGYDKAKKEILKKLKKRITAIKAMEAGKYLSKKHKITAPEIYQVKKADGTLAVKVRGCRLEGELTPEEIIQLPSAPSSYTLEGSIQSNTSSPAHMNSNYQQPKGISNGVFSAGIDSYGQEPAKLASKLNGVVYSYFPNTEFYVGILRVSSLPFTVANGGENLKVRFESYRDRDNFIIKYELEAGRDVK